jgi:ketosteroid isomerase-like protein
MPWFPDFVSAVELARQQTRAASQADPVAQYFKALDTADARALESVWPGQVVIYDPRAGEVRGHRHVRQFVGHNKSWLAGLHARTETVARTVVGGRAVVELLARLQEDGRELAWPVAVVAESPDERSVVFRTYCSQWPVFGHHYVRAPILKPQPGTASDVIGRYQAGVAAGDADAVVATFEPDGYFRGATGPDIHRGRTALRSYFSRRLSAGGIGVEDCAVTDDGERCAVEYNIVRWGERDLPHQAGIAVFDRGPAGLLAAARIYDDVQPPAEIEGSAA